MSKNQSGDDLNFKEDSDGEEKAKVDTIGITSKFHPKISSNKTENKTNGKRYSRVKTRIK